MTHIRHIGAYNVSQITASAIANRVAQEGIAHEQVGQEGIAHEQVGQEGIAHELAVVF